MNQNISKYDYIECIKKINKNEKIEYKGFVGFDLDKNIEKTILEGKQNEKGELVLKIDNEIFKVIIIDFQKTSPKYLEVFAKNQELNENIKKLQLNFLELGELNEKIKQEKTQQEILFKNQVIELEAKAQSKINEHRQKNDEHLLQQKTELKKYALQDFLEEFIKIYTKYDNALNFAKKSDNIAVNNFAKGFDMLKNDFENLMLDNGIKIIEPKVGDLFDPECQQITESIESKEPSGTILEVKSNGYSLFNRILKPASVIISK